MRSAALISLLSVATVFACANSRYSGISDGGAADGGGSSTASGSDGGKKKDSGSTTEEEDSGTTTKKDTGPEPSACAPGSVSGFTPSWTPPTAINQGACATSQITTLVDCLFNASANQTTCDTFLQAPANDACVKCSITENTAAAFGPMIVDADSLVTLNIAGCIARTANQLTSTGCAAKVQALGQCTDASCTANCPIPAGDDQALDARNQCMDDAETTECQTYATDAQCADALISGAAAPCAQGSTFEDRAKAYITLFCGQ